jgi:hypothetical protein
MVMQYFLNVRVFRACLSAAILAAGGCLAEPPPDDVTETEVSADVLADNGISVNGISVNGISVNGTSLNGISVNGISVNGISVNGISVNGISVSGSQLRGVYSTGEIASGAELVGASLTARLSDSTTLELRIDGTAMLPSPNADLRMYTVSYATSSGWMPLCPNANEALAFPGTWNLGTVRHQWDSNMFSFACRGATIAKCAELGYKSDSLLDTYHQACTRAIRADYCGDGQSHTITGTEINIFDRRGLQLDTQSWTVESNWTPDGATCIEEARVLTSLKEPDVSSCIARRAKVHCTTSSWPDDVLIRTEVNK